MAWQPSYSLTLQEFESKTKRETQQSRERCKPLETHRLRAEVSRMSRGGERAVAQWYLGMLRLWWMGCSGELVWGVENNWAIAEWHSRSPSHLQGGVLSSSTSPGPLSTLQNLRMSEFVTKEPQIASHFPFIILLCSFLYFMYFALWNICCLILYAPENWKNYILLWILLVIIFQFFKNIILLSFSWYFCNY